MATSGTATFNPDVNEIIEEAYERAGIEMRSGYDLRTARRSLNIMAAEWSNRGLNLWTVEPGTQALTAGTASYDLPADTIDIIEHVLRTNSGNSSTQNDRQLNRISVSSYASIPNKLTQAQPIQIYVDRLATPKMWLWPVPDSAQSYSVIYWRLRRVQDSGSIGSYTMDIPSRFIPAMVAGLAFHLTMKRPELVSRVIPLKQYYDEQFALAADEDRDRAPVRFVPQVGL